MLFRNYENNLMRKSVELLSKIDINTKELENTTNAIHEEDAIFHLETMQNLHPSEVFRINKYIKSSTHVKGQIVYNIVKSS